MSFPSVSPSQTLYNVSPTDENRIIKSGQSGAGKAGLTSVLPDLGTVTNGFTVGFAMERGEPHRIVIRSGRSENIAIVNETVDPRTSPFNVWYVKEFGLDFENQVVFLTIDEVGNWRVTGGSGPVRK